MLLTSKHMYCGYIVLIERSYINDQKVINIVIHIIHRDCGQFNPHLDKMFYYPKIYSKNKLKKSKKKLKIKRIFKTGGEYILKHKKLS